MWNDGGGVARTGLDVTVHGVLTAYHMGRKRKAIADDGQADH
jgi:hypothetical protein